MNKVAVGFTTKNRIELSKRSIEPLLQPNNFDLFWFDGSSTPEAENLPLAYKDVRHVYSNVRGGADAAAAFALTTMLDAPEKYDYVALVENDVLLHQDWFGPTMALFERGKAEGLQVGLVSSRAYEDRILIQRDGFGVMHNTGFGHAIYTRLAAKMLLQNMRTSMTSENRRVFAALTGIDVGRYWAFRNGEHPITADWGVDRVLAARGFASLALTPSPVEMIGQEPPLHEQGLTLVTKPVELLNNDDVFAHYVERTGLIRDRIWGRLDSRFYQAADGSYTFYAHQLGALGAKWSGDWRLHWSMGFGPFAWKAGEPKTYVGPDYLGTPIAEYPALTVPVSGPCQFLVSGGQHGGEIHVKDEYTGYEARPMLAADPNQIVGIVMPAAVTYRKIALRVLSHGVTIYGVRTQERQPIYQDFCFDHAVLPPI